jgi:hypothetical protein
VRITLLTVALLLALTSTAPSAPALGDKPPKWEYAELSYQIVPGRPAYVDEDGKEIPAVPASALIRWVAGAGEVEVKSWDELVTKLKAPAIKKGSATYQKIQVLNYLGGEGWELMEEHTPSPTPVAVGGGFGGRGPGGGGPGAGGPGGDRRPGSGIAFRDSYAPTTWLMKRRVP